MSHILHFSHANGFPGSSYAQLLTQLEPHFSVNYIDRLGHHPQFPVTDNWPNLERQLIQHFEHEYSEPVIAVGHSLGGILSMRVAHKRPDLVKAVVVLDVPAFSPWMAHSLRLAKWLKMMDKITPAGRTDGRRFMWSSVEEALEYFRSKPLMQGFDERCLRDYVINGTEPLMNDEAEMPTSGIQLRFKPEVEMSIYRTIPHDFSLTKPLPVPAAVLAGQDSNVFRQAHGQYMHKKLNMNVQWLPGSHLFPFEYPELTAQHIIQAIAEMKL